MKKRIKNLLLLLFAVVLVLCIAAAAGSRDAYADNGKLLHGDIYASDLEGVDDLLLDGNAAIILQDGDDVSIQCIRFTYNDNQGNRELVIKGSNAGTLRITGSDSGYGFIQMGTQSNLFIQGGHIIVGDGETTASTIIGNSGLLQISDGILEIKASKNIASSWLYGISVGTFRLMDKGIVNIDLSSTGGVIAVCIKELSITGGKGIFKAYTSGSSKSASGFDTPSSVDGHFYISGGEISIEASAPNGSGYGMFTAYNGSSGYSINIEGGALDVYGSSDAIYTAYNDNHIRIAGDAVVRATGGKRSAVFVSGALTMSGKAVLSAVVENTAGSGSNWSQYATVYVKDVYSLANTLKIVTPENGTWKTKNNGASYIADSYGGSAVEVVIAPVSNDNAWEARRIIIDGGKAFSSDKLYFVNGASATTDSSANWNAHYEPETGTLYLRNYEGKGISIQRGSYYNKKLTIDLTGSNTINQAGQFGIEAEGNDLEITSALGGSLTITGYHHGETAGCAAIATSWSSSSGNKGAVTVSGKAGLYIDLGSDRNLFGLKSSKDIEIKDHATLEISLFYGEDSATYFAGIWTDGSVYITTDQHVDVSNICRDSWSNEMSRSIYAFYLNNFRTANGECRFNVLNAEYASFAYVGKPNEGYSISNRVEEALGNGLAPGYDTYSFSGNDCKSVLIVSESVLNGSVPIVGATFPDPLFRSFVSEKIDNGDGWLAPSERNSVTSIDLYSGIEQIEDLHSIAGIEYFSNLKTLTFNDSLVRTFDPSVNTMNLNLLQKLYAGYNYLEEVDLSGLIDLTELELCQNQLKEIDTDDLMSLEYFDCNCNYDLDDLDLDNNTQLISVNFNGCDGIDYVDLRCLTDLQDLACAYCGLDSLDLSMNTDLQNLYCAGNYITALDVSMLEDLMYLQCYDNGMEVLTLGDLADLEMLHCYQNDISVLDLSGTPLIKDAYLNGVHTHNSSPNYEMYYTADATFYVDGTTSIVTDSTPASVRLKAANLTLEGKISINFKLTTDSTGLVAKLYYEKAGFAQVAEVPLNSSNYVADPENGDYYLVSYNEIPAKEMTLLLRIKVFDASGNPVQMQISSGYIDQYDYSVAQWCNNKINQNNNANDVMIAKALLNYGHYTQLALKYNDGLNGRPNKLANPNGYLSAEMAAFGSGNSAYDAVTTGGTALGAKAFALVLESDTSIKLKLKRQVEVLVDGSAATLNPEVDSDGTDIWAVYKSGIPAKKLHEKTSFKLTEGSNSVTMQYGALSWANKKLTGSDVNDKNLAKAMYLYNYAARKYFNYDAAGL